MNATIMMRADIGAPVLETWFEAGRKARLIVDDDLALHWCNRAGRTLLEGRGRLVLNGENVRPRNPAYAGRLLDFIRQADDDTEVLCLPDREGGNHLLVSAFRLGPGGLVGLTISFAQEGMDYHWADLREAFGLTTSERDIAQALSSGLTADAVAHKLQTSVKTVRTHIRHVYSKLGVSSREELFHKLMPYMVIE